MKRNKEEPVGTYKVRECVLTSEGLHLSTYVTYFSSKVAVKNVYGKNKWCFSIIFCMASLIYLCKEDISNTNLINFRQQKWNTLHPNLKILGLIEYFCLDWRHVTQTLEHFPWNEIQPDGLYFVDGLDWSHSNSNQNEYKVCCVYYYS